MNELTPVSSARAGRTKLADEKALALVIAHAYPCGWLEQGALGESWSPTSKSGRHWSRGKALEVLERLIAQGLGTQYESHRGAVVRTNEAGFKFFDLAGKPGISDAAASRFFGYTDLV